MTHQEKAASIPGKRTRNPKGTREALVRAALDLFTTSGYHASTTPMIASRAGIAEGTIYRHFDSKEQLLNEIYRAAVRLLTAAIGNSSTHLLCRQRLETILDAWRKVAIANPPLIKLVFCTDLSGLLDARSEAEYGRLVEELETVMATGKSANQVRAGSARIWADVWFRLAALVLERTASGDWPVDHPAPQQVTAAAWTAIAAPTL